MIDPTVGVGDIVIVELPLLPPKQVTGVEAVWDATVAHIWPTGKLYGKAEVCDKINPGGELGAVVV